MTAKLVLRKPDPKAKQYFASEKRYLLSRLPSKSICDIFHFGSTAVPGLRGKGFVDIYLVLKSKKDLPKVLSRLLDADYTRPVEGGSKERIFLRRHKKIVGKDVTFHLHVSWKNAKGWKDDLLFTEYLLRHPDIARRYEKLKYVWAERVKWKRRKYLKKKTRWIKQIVKKAKSEMS